MSDLWSEGLSASCRLDDKCCINSIYGIGWKQRLSNSQFSGLQIIKPTLYSDTEITLRAVITTSSACESTSICTKQPGTRSGRKVGIFPPRKEKRDMRMSVWEKHMEPQVLVLGEAMDVCWAVWFWTFFLCRFSEQKGSPPSRAAAGRPQHQSHTQVSAWPQTASLSPSYLSLPAAAAALVRTGQKFCRRRVSFPKRGTVTASRLCLEVWPSQPRSPPVLDLLFHSYNFLTAILPKAAAPVPSLPNFLFGLGLLELLSLCLQCWAS